MSLKTLRKRIALVAVAALGIGLLSITPSSADGFDSGTDILDCEVASIKSTGNECVTATGNRATVSNYVMYATDSGDDGYTYADADTTPILAENTAAGTYYIKVTGATIVTATESGTSIADITWGGINDADGLVDVAIADGAAENTDLAAGVLELVLERSTAGDATVEFISFSAGVRTTVEKHTISWVDASSSYAISATNSQMFFESDSCEASGASAAGDAASSAAGLDQISSATASSGDVYVCLYTRDGNGNAVDPASGTVVTTFGLWTGTSSKSTTLSTTTGALTSLTAAYFEGQTAETGEATVTAVITDNAGNTITLSKKITFYGTLSTLSVAPLVGSAYAASDRTTLSATYTAAQYATKAAGTLNALIVGVTAKDAKGNVIDLATAANSTATSAWTVDSDRVAGAAAARTNDSLATVSAMNVAGEISPALWGANAAYIECSTTPEKLTVTAWGKNALGAWVSSNSVDIFCAGAASTVSVSVDANKVNVDVKDAKGYPVADNTSVTLAASNGAVVAPTSKSTTNGKFSTAATFIPSSTAASATVTAIVGSATGTSAAVKGTGSNVETSIASIVAAIAKLQKAINKINKRLAR